MRSESLQSCAIAAALLACSAAAAQAPSQPATVERAIDTVQQTQRASAASQQRVDRLDADTRQLLERYRAATWQAQQLKVYAAQIGELAKTQGSERDSLQRQIGEMEKVERELLPLMLRMIDSLEKFVELDLPFLEAERRERMANLRRLMADPEAGVSDKYRRILEAYQIEVDYGRTLGAERVEVEGRVMDQLRVGRSALYALALDGTEALRWENDSRKWLPLERGYVNDVRHGLRIARELASADLLRLPMALPEATP